MAIISNAVTIADAGAFSASLGAMTHIKTLTASSSSTLSFVDGAASVVLDDTYPIYKFVFVNIHVASANQHLTWQASTDSGSNYNTACTSTAYGAQHNEGGTFTQLGRSAAEDAAQSTSFIPLATENHAIENDDSYSGTLNFFNPSSTTFVKHWMLTAAQVNTSGTARYVCREELAGYFNTTSAIDAVQFKMTSGNIDSGQIKLYGIKDS